MKMASYSNGNETYFHKKGFALNVVLKVQDFWNLEMAHPGAVLSSAFSTPHKKVQSIFSFDLHSQLLRFIKSYLHISFMF